MKAQERLFLAIGEADPELIARSEQKRRSRRPGHILTAAACLALVLTLGRVLSPWTDAPGIQAPGVSTPSNQTDPNVDAPALVLPEQGSEIGALRLLSCAPQSQDEVDFLIYVNEDQFDIWEDQGLYRIRSTTLTSETLPKCGLDIVHLSAVSPDEAKQSAAEALGGRYAEIFREEESGALAECPYLRASDGTDWDSEQAELWFVSDGQAGTFVLTSRYFLEAEEGLGMRFRDMVSSFRVVSLTETVPEWMRSLRETVDRLFPALLANDLSGVSDLLAEDAQAGAYGEDVWDHLTVASVDYAPDDDQAPASAIVSVKHRLNREEGEVYHYLTMKLTRQDGQWRLVWSGIER